MLTVLHYNEILEHFTIYNYKRNIIPVEAFRKLNDARLSRVNEFSFYCKRRLHGYLNIN